MPAKGGADSRFMPLETAAKLRDDLKRSQIKRFSVIGGRGHDRRPDQRQCLVLLLRAGTGAAALRAVGTRAAGLPGLQHLRGGLRLHLSDRPDRPLRPQPHDPARTGSARHRGPQRPPPRGRVSAHRRRHRGPGRGLRRLGHPCRIRLRLRAVQVHGRAAGTVVPEPRGPGLRLPPGHRHRRRTRRVVLLPADQSREDPAAVGGQA